MNGNGGRNGGGASGNGLKKVSPKNASAAPASSGDWSGGIGVLPGREMIGPIFLMAVTPPFSIVVWHLLTARQGDWIGFCREVSARGFVTVLTETWPTPWNPTIWQWIGYFLLFEILLLKLVPGKTFVGNVTPQGNRPIYKANGLQCYFLTLAATAAIHHYGWFDLGQVYDHYGEILSSLNVLSWILCFTLFVKGHTFPSSTDSGSTGSLLYDFYWGMELYPRILTVDVKQVTNCRGGMMWWAVGIICYAVKNAQLQPDGGPYPTPAMAASVIIQLVYVTKFFAWETGYLNSMDIQHDRAGYYLCWGCLVWVPSVYTSQAMYLVRSTTSDWCTWEMAAGIVAAGVVCVLINYESDWQRYVFRQSGGARYSFWFPNAKPRHIVATYATATGKTQTSLLLVDGWWRLSRHFHYLPEILASFFWTVSAGWELLPYFYVVYLTCLLLDRAWRDDDRCRKKYGKDWDKYCSMVPYKIVPGII
jgi:7-dehydrocholesterol reductase